MIAMIAAIAEGFFFLRDPSDRRDHMETGYNQQCRINRYIIRIYFERC